MVGLYLAPPENAIVLCVDEKSQIQALDRTAPMLPMQPGLPERRTHDYVRHGTTTLFAALDIATGKVTAALQAAAPPPGVPARSSSRSPAPTPTGELHLVMDNYAAHKRVEVRDWLAANPRIHVHFTPTSASWMNLVEVWFGIIERQAIHRGTFASRHRPQRQDPRLHRRLERPLPPVRLDQDRRPDPRQSQPEEDFRRAALGHRVPRGVLTTRQKGRAMSSSEGGQVTGTQDKDYNLIWFTEQCLSNVLRLETYVQDADRDGDSELAGFFRRAQAESKKGADQAKSMLAKRLSG